MTRYGLKLVFLRGSLLLSSNFPLGSPCCKATPIVDKYEEVVEATPGLQHGLRGSLKKEAKEGMSKKGKGGKTKKVKSHKSPKARAANKSRTLRRLRVLRSRSSDACDADEDPNGAVEAEKAPAVDDSLTATKHEHVDACAAEDSTGKGKPKGSKAKASAKAKAKSKAAPKAKAKATAKSKAAPKAKGKATGKGKRGKAATDGSSAGSSPASKRTSKAALPDVEGDVAPKQDRIYAGRQWRYVVLPHQTLGCISCRFIFKGCRACKEDSFRGRNAAQEREEQQAYLAANK